MTLRGFLDNDFYQFTMSQYAWRHEPRRTVRYRFRNRTFAVRLGDVLDLDLLKARLDAVTCTGVTREDVNALRSLGQFEDEWLDWLSTIDRLPDVEIGVHDGHLEVSYEGPWPLAIFLETPVLATVSELYQGTFGAHHTEATRRLDAKIDHLARNPHLRFMEFGTRRRHSADWQAHVIERLVAEVPQSVLGDARLFPSLTVAENLGLALERHLETRDMLAAATRLPAVADTEHNVAITVYELIELLGLKAFASKFVSELSTGSRRIVDLGMALAHRPEVLILDEPSSGIAQRETEALGPLLVRIHQELGCSLLVIEHDMPLLLGISDRLLALETGTLIAEGPPDEVINDPSVVASYLDTDESVVYRSGARPRRSRTRRERIRTSETRRDGGEA